MKKQILKYIGILFAIMLIPALSGCNDTDDVQKIFTGKTWKMTYITKKGEHRWYTFPGVDEKNYLSYDPTTGTRAFRITFTGSTSENRINGDFKRFRFCGYERYMGSKWRKTNFPNNCKR